MKLKNRIGISGGTFDPIHYGHLIMAELAREEFNLHKILFIPSGSPPHKDNANVTNAEHRFNMVHEATKSNDFFKAVRTEIDRTGYTYTIDTLKQLKHIYGVDSILFFIIGADVVFDLLTWRNIEEVFKLCEFIAVFRQGFDEKRFSERVEYLEKNYSAVIHTMNTPQIDISSTLIRQRAYKGLSIKYLVPECVEEYIAAEHLYKYC